MILNERDIPDEVLGGTLKELEHTGACLRILVFVRQFNLLDKEISTV